MEKILIQFFVIVISFFGVWFLLSRIDFVHEEDVQKFARESEQKLGELILKSITATSDEIENEKAKGVLDSIKTRLCKAKGIDCDRIKIHLIRSSEINAFALPDYNMVIYSGLLDYAKGPEEVAGVMAHEIGHMEKKHVMKKLIKEIGLEMLFTIAAGDAGNDIARETAKVMSSTAFDRKHEREADEFAVETLALANIDPEHLSNLFFRLSRQQDMPEELAWVSTHPDSKERAAEILRIKKEYTFKEEPIIRTPWEEVKKLLTADSEETTDHAEATDAVADTVAVK